MSHSLVTSLVHDAVVQVKAAGRQHHTAAGHHPLCLFFSKDDGTGIIYRDGPGGLGAGPLLGSSHLQRQGVALSGQVPHAKVTALDQNGLVGVG